MNKIKVRQRMRKQLLAYLARELENTAIDAAALEDTEGEEARQILCEEQQALAGEFYRRAYGKSWRKRLANLV